MSLDYKEPTDDDIRAGVRAFQSGHNGFDDLSDWRAFYRTVSTRHAEPSALREAAQALLYALDYNEPLAAGLFKLRAALAQEPPGEPSRKEQP
jgi:hypothetical protein